MRASFRLSRRSLIAWVAVIALGLHSFIPAGFMPDFSGHGMLTVCDGMNHMPMGHMHHGQDGHAHGNVCPFSFGTIFAFEGVKTTVIAAPVYGQPQERVLAGRISPSRMGFGNASPRSPPFLG